MFVFFWSDQKRLMNLKFSLTLKEAPAVQGDHLIG